MNRRDFVKSSLAVAVSGALPAFTAEAKEQDFDEIDEIIYSYRLANAKLRRACDMPSARCNGEICDMTFHKDGSVTFIGPLIGAGSADQWVRFELL